jgi:RpiB/LacA/LacB family sugar-phosphate isomerase
MTSAAPSAAFIPFAPTYRAWGVLLHVSSLPSPFGIGDVGPAALTAVDRLQAAGQGWWQALPLGSAAWHVTAGATTAQRRAVVAGEVERGIAIYGSGVGASVCANKVPGVRAALIHDNYSARQGVENDHMNMLCMGGRTVGPAIAWDLVQTFLAAEFSRAEPHLRRLGKVSSLEGVPNG